MFKIGDKVRLLGNNLHDIYVIEDIRDNKVSVSIDGNILNHNNPSIFDSSIFRKVITKPKYLN